MHLNFSKSKHLYTDLINQLRSDRKWEDFRFKSSYVFNVNQDDYGISEIIDMYINGVDITKQSAYLHVPGFMIDEAVPTSLSFAFTSEGQPVTWRDIVIRTSLDDTEYFCAANNRYNDNQCTMDDLLFLKNTAVSLYNPLEYSIEIQSTEEWTTNPQMLLTFQQVDVDFKKYFLDWYSARGYMSALYESRLAANHIFTQEEYDIFARWEIPAVLPIAKGGSFEVQDLSQEDRKQMVFNAYYPFSEKFKKEARISRFSKVMALASLAHPIDINSVLEVVTLDGFESSYIQFGIMGKDFSNNVTGAGNISGLYDYISSQYDYSGVGLQETCSNTDSSLVDYIVAQAKSILIYGS